MQVLKEKVKNKIFSAAEEIFYEKDYRSAKLTDIAERAEVPVALIYTYFKNKEVLFDSVVNSVYISFSEAINAEEAETEGTALKRFEDAGQKYLHELLKNHKRLVILMDKSAGTKHEKAKEKLVKQLEHHIKKMGIKRLSEKKYDPILIHILANNYTEGLLEIARHYEGEKRAKEILTLMNQCYYKGVESL
ncbi:TetR/AcrR family transcriptional regulator [Treponema pedis]|uniref:TetR family transcriptional regulator n=3 Tax=Treponema pedis TaxID=409322 RepID=S6A4I5_9SPIR|nr:TetR/AcrR family transcriptional regulator [Treponema pedis]AGT44466.1 TetR family transcriptional regulator [Treponema pedis str. T A4]